MIIAQLSDFHARPRGTAAYGDVDTNAMMRRAVAALLALDPLPDCVLVTGDLTDCGLPEEYDLVREALADLPMPVFPVPGNHDRRETFAAGLGGLCSKLPATGFQHYTVEDYPVRLIGLDTLVAGEHGGALCPEREAWLAARLGEGDGRPTLIFMHHPPFLTGIDGMDVMLCTVSPELPELIARHPEIERIVCGHYHRPIVRRWAGTLGFVAPGTAHQVALDLRPGVENRFILEPPGFALHVWRDGVGLVSHSVPIGDFGPRRDFVLDPAYPGQHADA
ncbi:phosphodiesterase [Chelatococcus sp. GCM10030263]|uniref:phosphodiesterase n=1 Tax=Chelatococcus sp. GCM10030263 TaxID=3273387 RepID=UPI00362358CE